MLALCIPVAWILLALLLRQALGGRRMALLFSAIAIGTWLIIGTELLGVFGWLTRAGVITWWIVTDILLIIGLEMALPPFHLWLPPRSDKKWTINEYATAALIGVAALLLAIAGISAVLKGAHNGVINESISQTATPPLVGYIRLHYIILSNGDRWANSVSWQSAVMTMMAASSIVALAGGGPVAQALAALLVIANPPFFLAASTPNNDVLLAQWITTLTVLALMVLRTESLLTPHAVWIAITLVLILLTKGTGWVFAIPILALIAGAMYSRRRTALKWGSAVLLIAAVIVSPFWLWNFQAPGYPTRAPALQSTYLNQDHSPPALAAVLLCNIGTDLQMPADNATHLIATNIKSLRGQLLGITDDSPQWQSNARSGAPFQLGQITNLEPLAGAPAQIALAALLPLLGLLTKRSVRGTSFWLLLPLPYAAFLLYSFVFRWHITGARLELPAFCLLAPPAALLLTTRPMRIPALIILLTIFANLIPTIASDQRLAWNLRVAKTPPHIATPALPVVASDE